jgi:hypothetical protein
MSVVKQIISGANTSKLNLQAQRMRWAVIAAASSVPSSERKSTLPSAIGKPQTDVRRSSLGFGFGAVFCGGCVPCSG